MFRMLKLALNSVCRRVEGTGFPQINILLVNISHYLPHHFSKVAHLHGWISPMAKVVMFCLNFLIDAFDWQTNDSYELIIFSVSKAYRTTSEVW